MQVARVEVVDWSLANAFALPLAGSLVFTTRCCEVLNDPQPAAITAHELGHLGEPAPARVARFAAGFLLLPLGAGPLLFGCFGPWGLAVPLALLMFAAIVLPRLGRRLEERADGVAQRAESVAGSSAEALAALYRDNGAPLSLPVAFYLILAPLSAHFETDPEARVAALPRSMVLRSGRAMAWWPWPLPSTSVVKPRRLWR